MTNILQHRSYRVLANRDIADGIFELRLAPDSADDALSDFCAGQWAYLELPNASGSLRAPYSIANAPSEFKDGTVLLAIRRAGAVSTRASELRAGDEVHLQGPFGRFVFDAEAEASVFLAGGIGITPFRSMIFEAMDSGYASPVTLFSSARLPVDLPYRDACTTLAKKHPSFRYVPVCTRASSEWEGERERISADMIARHVEHPDEASYYICGSKSFVEGMIALLFGLNIPKERIHVERFS